MAQPANNGGPGNSGAAKMCQNGGWERIRGIQEESDWYTFFANEEECVSFGAHGGILEVIPSPSIQWTFTSGSGTCTASFEVVNLQPNTTYYYTVTVNRYIWASWVQISIMTDGNGTLNGPNSTWTFSGNAQQNGADIPIAVDINSSNLDPHAYRVLTSRPMACPSS
jgi:hypothetical protein